MKYMTKKLAAISFIVIFLALFCITLIYCAKCATSYIEYRKIRNIATYLYTFEPHSSNKEWKLYCECFTFAGISTIDKINKRTENERKISNLLSKISHTPSFKESVLNKGVLNGLFEIKNRAADVSINEEEIARLILWQTKQYKNHKKTGKVEYLFQDAEYCQALHDLWIQIGTILSTDTVSNQDFQEMLSSAEQGHEQFFINKGLAIPVGRGVDMKTPIDFRIKDISPIQIVLEYADTVYNSTGIKLIRVNNENPELFKIILYSRTYKKSFYLYILGDTIDLGEYTLC